MFTKHICHHHHQAVALARIIWPCLATSHYHSSPLAGLQGYIPYVHIAAVCMFELVVLLLLGHIHQSTSLMSSFLLLLQCPASLVRLTLIVFVIAGRWPYIWCIVKYCHWDLFNITRYILVQLPSSFFSSCFVYVQVVYPYSNIDNRIRFNLLTLKVLFAFRNISQEIGIGDYSE